MGIWESAKEVAHNIAKAGWGDNAKISKAFSADALSDLGGAARRSDMYSAIKNVVNNSNLEDEAAKNVLKGLDTNAAIETFDIAGLAAKEGRTEAFNKAVEAFNKAKNMNVNEGVGLKGLAKGYFGDPELGSTRLKATAGAAVAGGIGIRYLQGGTLTEKPNGERDIAGIPFV